MDNSRTRFGSILFDQITELDETYSMQLNTELEHPTLLNLSMSSECVSQLLSDDVIRLAFSQISLSGNILRKGEMRADSFLNRAGIIEATTNVALWMGK